MVDPTLTIDVDRTGMVGSLPPLAFSAVSGAVDLGIVGYQPPAMQSRVTYAPDASGVNGSVPLSSSIQQSILGWDWVLDTAATEADVQAARDEVWAAISRFSFLVTTAVSGAPSEVWRCDAGSMVLRAGTRSYTDLSNRNPVYAITIPVYPIPGGVG